MKFWPFPIWPLYPINPDLSRLFTAFAQAPDLEFHESDPRLDTGYRQRATCSFGTLEIWNSNRWYAWASSGTFTNAAGESLKWDNEMPSRTAMHLMRVRLKRWERSGDFRLPADALKSAGMP